ncbi:MAG TPA: hypothetical protein VHC97_23200 [Thermoanaerobaculia bacterium]|jgi:hypothetical protein|nr:hypothetical protein [Thermoanaerobaculia bacterium]
MRLALFAILAPLLLSESTRLPTAAPPAPKPQTAPNPDAEKQRQTIADIRNLGTALFSWLTDEAGAAAAGKTESVDLRAYPEVTMADLEKLLVPDYIPAVSKTDAWGHPLEVRVNVKDVLAEKIMSIRSPGRDGKFSGDTYTSGSFTPSDYDQDIVWTDGFFLRWPERQGG